MIYEINDEDARALAGLCYEPQKVSKLLDKCRLHRGVGEICFHPSAERVKLAETDDPEFQHVQFGFRCVDCNRLVDPLIVGYRSKELR